MLSWELDKRFVSNLKKTRPLVLSGLLLKMKVMFLHSQVDMKVIINLQI